MKKKNNIGHLFIFFISVIMLFPLSIQVVSAQSTTSMSAGSMSLAMLYTGTNALIMWAIIVAGISIGAASITFIFLGMKGLGGEIAKAFALVLLGITFQVFSYIWEGLDTYFGFVDMQHDMIIHMSLMLIGMIMFVLAAQRFLKLSH